MLRNLGELVLALALGLLLGGFIVKQGPSLPVSLAVAAVLIALFSNGIGRFEGDDSRLLQQVFILSAVGRVLLAVSLQNVIRDPATLAGDDSGYELVGQTIARFWGGELDGLHAKNPFPNKGFQATYVYWNAILFYVFGQEVTLLPKCINAVMGSFLPVLFYHITLRLSSKEAARLALYITSIAPSMILWSVLNLRDTAAILAITASIYYTVVLKERFSIGSLLALLIAMFAVTTLRTYMFLILGVALGISFIGFRPGHEARDLSVGLLVALVLAYLFRSLGLGDSQVIQSASFEQLHEMRRGLASGGSAYAVGADVSSPLKALLFLPVGVVYFLFAPFPWQLANFRQLLAFPEVLLFYLLFPSMVRGVRRAIREDLARWLPVLLAALLVTVCYAVVEGNVGTAFRHKAQVLGLFFIFAAYDIAARRAEAK